MRPIKKGAFLKERRLVPKGGVEPPRPLRTLRPERSASTSSTTSACRAKCNETR